MPIHHYSRLGVRIRASFKQKELGVCWQPQVNLAIGAVDENLVGNGALKAPTNY